MRLFQYWDTGAPPDDVAGCIQSVRDLNPEFQYELFDRDSAAWFIGKRIDRAHRDAFLSLAVPAAQSDYFRLCALWARGGLWLDADFRCVRNLGSLLDGAPGGYLSMLNNIVQNAPIFVPRTENHYVGACLELAHRQVTGRIEGTASDVTGPLVLNLIWAAVDPVGGHEDPHRARDKDFKTTREAAAVAALFPGAAEAMAQITRRHDLWTAHWLRAILGQYKLTSVDWRRWTGSLYFEKPAVQDPMPAL